MVKGKLSRNSKQGHSILLKTQISEPCHWPGMVLNKISFNFSSCLSTRLFGLLSKRTMLSCQMREGMAYYTFKKKKIYIYLNLLMSCWILVEARELLVAACGILFPDQGWNPVLLHWEHGVLATGLLGEPHTLYHYY